MHSRATALQRRLERRLERRYPALYDARHAASGIGPVVWPILGPLLAMIVLFPIVVVLAWLWDLSGLQAPSVGLPSVDVPDIPWPTVTAPGWLQAVGEVLAAVLSVVGPAAKYVVLAGAVIFGVRRTQAVRRRRTAAAALGRTELASRSCNPYLVTPGSTSG